MNLSVVGFGVASVWMNMTIPFFRYWECGGIGPRLQVQARLGIEIDFLCGHAARHHDDGDVQPCGTMAYQFGDERARPFSSRARAEHEHPDLGVVRDQAEHFLVGLPLPGWRIPA